MFRLVPLGASALALLLAAPAVGADYMEGFRMGFPDEGETESPLGFEVGVGYWYSQGDQTFTIDGDSEFTTTDTSQFGEVFLRIDDFSTSSYLDADVGYAYSISGTSDQPFVDDFAVVDGSVVHAGADFGYNPFGTARDGQGITPIVGYRYWNDSPNIGRGNFTTAASSDDVTWNLDDPIPTLPMGGENNNVDVHALRLGLGGKFQFNEYIDVSGEVAAVPYAWVNGTYGAFGGSGGLDSIGRYVVQGSPMEIVGSAYGGMGELSLGIHPMENMTLRLGGRAWYVQGTVDTTFDTVVITRPIDIVIDSDGDGDIDGDDTGDGVVDVEPVLVRSPSIIESNPFSMMRYGATASLSVSF